MEEKGALIGNFTAQMIAMVTAQQAAKAAKYAEEEADDHAA